MEAFSMVMLVNAGGAKPSGAAMKRGAIAGRQKDWPAMAYALDLQLILGVLNYRSAAGPQPSPCGTRINLCGPRGTLAWLVDTASLAGTSITDRHGYQKLKAKRAMAQSA